MVLQEPAQIRLPIFVRALREESASRLCDDLETLSFINYVDEGYPNRRFAESKKMETIIKDDPDLIIFEISLINNHYQSLSLEQTEKD